MRSKIRAGSESTKKFTNVFIFLTKYCTKLIYNEKTGQPKFCFYLLKHFHIKVINTKAKLQKRIAMFTFR